MPDHDPIEFGPVRLGSEPDSNKQARQDPDSNKVGLDPQHCKKLSCAKKNS